MPARDGMGEEVGLQAGGRRLAAVPRGPAWLLRPEDVALAARGAKGAGFGFLLPAQSLRTRCGAAGRTPRGNGCAFSVKS